MYPKKCIHKKRYPIQRFSWNRKKPTTKTFESSQKHFCSTKLKKIRQQKQFQRNRRTSKFPRCPTNSTTKKDCCQQKKFSTKPNLAKVSTRGHNNVEHLGNVFKCLKTFVGTCVEKKTNFSN